MQTIGKRLAEIRKSRKFKQIELAEILYIIFDYSHKHYTFKQFEV